jgi:hypothetical protein
MKNLALSLLFAVVALVGLLAAYPLAGGTKGERSDCPGKVVCPLTGEEVCKDQCLLAVKQAVRSRADCPGQVECPLTGELVCRDKCPVAAAPSKEKTDEVYLPLARK